MFLDEKDCVWNENTYSFSLVCRHLLKETVFLYICSSKSASCFVAKINQDLGH